MKVTLDYISNFFQLQHFVLYETDQKNPLLLYTTQDISKVSQVDIGITNEKANSSNSANSLAPTTSAT